MQVASVVFVGASRHHSRMSDDDSKYPSELAERFQVRLPMGMRDRIKAAAEANNRSMNAEIVATLEEKYPAPKMDFDTIVSGSLFWSVFAAPSWDAKQELLENANRELAEHGFEVELHIDSAGDLKISSRSKSKNQLANMIAGKQLSKNTPTDD